MLGKVIQRAVSNSEKSHEVFLNGGSTTNPAQEKHRESLPWNIAFVTLPSNDESLVLYLVWLQCSFTSTCAVPHTSLPSISMGL